MKKMPAILLSVLLSFSIALGLFDVTAFAAKKPKLNVSKLSLTVNTDFNLRVYNLKKKQKVTFTSADPQVVSLEPDAKSPKRVVVHAISVGSSVVTATVRKNNNDVVRKLKCKVKVSPTAISIKFFKRKLDMNPGDQFELAPVIKPNTSREQPIFESDDPSVATVNSRGVVTAVSPGLTTITATLLSNGQTATCTVIVKGSDDDDDSLEENTIKNRLLGED